MNSYQMVLHRPVETALLYGVVMTFLPNRCYRLCGPACDQVNRMSHAKRRSKVKNTMKLPNKRLCLMGLTLGVGLTCGAVVRAQTATANLQQAVENIQSPQDQKIQQLQDQLEEIQKELMELKKANSTHPETHHTTTAKASVAPPNLSEAEPEVTDPSSPHSEPFAFADFTWLNGNARTKDTPYATKFFTPEIRSDVSYTYD